MLKNSCTVISAFVPMQYGSRTTPRFFDVLNGLQLDRRVQAQTLNKLDGSERYVDRVVRLITSTADVNYPE